MLDNILNTAKFYASIYYATERHEKFIIHSLKTQTNADKEGSGSFVHSPHLRFGYRTGQPRTPTNKPVQEGLDTDLSHRLSTPNHTVGRIKCSFKCDAECTAHTIKKCINIAFYPISFTMSPSSKIAQSEKATALELAVLGQGPALPSRPSVLSELKHWLQDCLRGIKGHICPPAGRCK